MSLIINNLGKLPLNFKFEYVKIQPLGDYDMQIIRDLCIDEVWYFYASGSYEGYGYILMRKGDLFDLHDARHCSCYGPTEYLKFSGKSIEDLKKSLSEELLNESLDLFNKAEESFKTKI